MSTTTRLLINLLDEGQRQKEAAINDALNIIDDKMHKVQYRGVSSGKPVASANTHSLIIVTDLGANGTLCYSDGTNWRQVIAINGTIVS